MEYANRVLMGVVAVVGVPTVYVLSVGPAWGLVNCDWLDFRTFTACYDPLLETAKTLGLVDWLRWYTELWR